MKDIIEGKCPKCREGKVFKDNGNPFAFRMAKMNEHCPSCNAKFEREPGFFFGAMYVSYGLTVFEAIVVFGLMQFFFEKTFDPRIIGIIAAVIILCMNFNYRLSRIIWVHMFPPESGNSIQAKKIEG